jgi:hypothetical protein
MLLETFQELKSTTPLPLFTQQMTMFSKPYQKRDLKKIETFSRIAFHSANDHVFKTLSEKSYEKNRNLLKN